MKIASKFKNKQTITIILSYITMTTMGGHEILHGLALTERDRHHRGGTWQERDQDYSKKKEKGISVRGCEIEKNLYEREWN